MLRIKIKTYWRVLWDIMYLPGFLFLGACTAQFCSLNMFPVMMVGCKMVSRQAVLLLSRSKKLRSQSFWGYRNIWLSSKGGWEEGEVFIFIPVLTANIVRPTVAGAEISLQTSYTAAHSSARGSGFSFLASAVLFFWKQFPYGAIVNF